MGDSGPRDQCHWVRVLLLDLDRVNARYATTYNKNQRKRHLVAQRKLAKPGSQCWTSEAAGRATFRKVYNRVWHETIMCLRATTIFKTNIAITCVQATLSRRQQHRTRHKNGIVTRNQPPAPLRPWLLLLEAPNNSFNGLTIDTKYR